MDHPRSEWPVAIRQSRCMGGGRCRGSGYLKGVTGRQCAHAAVLSGAWAVGRSDVADDEDLLAGPNQVQIAPRNFLDCLGILPEPMHLPPQLRILVSNPCELARQGLVFTPRLEHRGQSACADERIERERAPHERQGNLQQTRTERRSDSHLAFGRSGWRCRFHVVRDPSEAL